MAGKKTKNVKIELANTPVEQVRRVWLAGLGAFSLTRKHGGQWFGRFAEEGQELVTRTAQFAQESVADARAQATGVVAIVERIEKQFGSYAQAVETGFGRALNYFGIPTKREIDDLSRQIAALSRRLNKAAK